MLELIISVVMNVLGTVAEPLNNRYREGVPLLARRPRR